MEGIQNTRIPKETSYILHKGESDAVSPDFIATGIAATILAGKSAYELAVKYGYEGTEEEFSKLQTETAYELKRFEKATTDSFEALGTYIGSNIATSVVIDLSAEDYAGKVSSVVELLDAGKHLSVSFLYDGKSYLITDIKPTTAGYQFSTTGVFGKTNADGSLTLRQQKFSIDRATGVVTPEQFKPLQNILPFSKEEREKLNGIEEGANKYTHPFSHPASMISETSARCFVSPAEKQTWNDKQDALVSGKNIKTINGQSLLGKGNLTIAGGSGGNDMSGDLMLVRTGKIVGIGQTWQQPLSFTPPHIGNYSDELLDSNQYRLVFMFTRKTRYSKINSGIRWVVPMNEATKQNKGGFGLPESETYAPITGKKMTVTSPNHFRPKLRYYNSRFLFRQTNNSRLKIGVAIFKYTGASDPVWYRCSNIYGIEYCLGNRRISNTTGLPKQINTRYIME